MESPSPDSTGPDARAVAALLDCFEVNGRLRPEVYGDWLGKAAPIRNPEAFAYAKSRLVMFDPRTLDHDQIIAWARRSVAAVTIRDAANAFVSSLQTRALHRRSALASLALLRHLPVHPWEASPFWQHSPCRVCGEYKAKASLIDLNRLSYARHRGSTGTDDVVSAAFDLEVFAAEPADASRSRGAWELLKGILDAASSLGPRDSAAKLSKVIRGVFAGNDRERQQVIETLGACGVLESPDQPGFRTRWVPREDRQDPDGKNDWSYPVLWWRGANGVNADAVREWFGHSPINLLA